MDYLDETALEILILLKDTRKRYSELQKESLVSPGAFSMRINQLIDLGLVKVEYNQKERCPFYSLTPTGRKILELLEEIKRIHKEGVSLEEKELKWIEESLKKSEEG